MKADLKSAVFNYSMLAALLLVLILLFRTMLGDANANTEADYLEYILAPMATSGFTPFAVLFPLLPYSVRFADEYNSGYLRFSVMRFGKNRYIFSKIISTGISGGLTIAIPFAIVFLYAMFTHSAPTATSYSDFYSGTVWEAFIINGVPVCVVLYKLLLAFLFGCVWSIVGLMISQLLPNRYATIIIAFVIYQLLWLVLAFTPFNPVYLLRGDWGYFTSVFQVIGIELAYLVLAIIGTKALYNRRIKNV